MLSDTVDANWSARWNTGEPYPFPRSRSRAPVPWLECSAVRNGRGLDRAMDPPRRQVVLPSHSLRGLRQAMLAQIVSV